MQYRPLGRTGMQVSAITLGAMLFGKETSADAAIELVDRAIDRGINSVDTANVYVRGESETILGQALRRNARRDRLVLASKFHARVGDDPNAAGSSRRHIMEQVDVSLRRLGVDHLDIYYIHRPTTLVPIDETLRAMDDLVRAGKIRYVGTSSFAAWQVLESLWAAKEHHLVRTVVEQTPYSLLDRRVERELLPMAQTYGVGITVWSPLSGGVLTGKYRAGPAEPADGPRDSRFGTDDTDSDWARKHFNPTADAIVDAVVQMARDKGCSPAQLSLAWLLAQSAVSSVIIGARDEAQLTDQLDAVGVELSAEELARLDEISPPGRAAVPYFLDDSFADRRPHLHRW